MTNSKNSDTGFYVQGTGFAPPSLAPGLYVVSTPIGNLRDITLRALETLAAVDLVLCEDTRMSARLLDHFGIKTRRAALHEHNEHARIESILQRLANGQSIALISDAGTPLLSDPGFPLVRAVGVAGHEIFAVPGASALLSALAIAGLPTDSFSFFGFLPTKSKARKNMLSSLSAHTQTLVFYESPRRLAATIAAMSEIFGPEREAAVAMELTKKFERVSRGKLGELAEKFSEGETRGEAVILVAGASEVVLDEHEWQSVLENALKQMPLRAAVDEVTSQFPIKRKQVYNAALAIKQEKS